MVLCQDEAGTVPGGAPPRSSWQPTGRPSGQEHAYVRGGTVKLLTLFHPATGQVWAQAVQQTPNRVLHPWLTREPTAILAALPARDGEPVGAVATRVSTSTVSTRDVDTGGAAAAREAWAQWQAGLSEPFTLPEYPPPLRALLIWDNLAGHRTGELVRWLCAHGIMPLYTPLSGPWLNLAESIQRILVRRALAGHHPTSTDELTAWLTASVAGWNAAPTPFAGWQARRSASTGASAPAPVRRLGRLHPTATQSPTYRPWDRHQWR
ncbi:MAG: transposase [Chloroflexota bacterium]